MTLKMSISLHQLLKNFADALQVIDGSGVSHKTFRPGIGPFGEADATKAALTVLRQRDPATYGQAVTKRHPDLLVPNQWQIELKVIRPFGDNGKEAENWSQNLLHPYVGNTSSIGDCIKLANSTRPEKRAIIVFGFEHEPARISLDPCIRGFELLTENLLHIHLTKRIEELRKPLIHPEHQVLRVFGWEVLGMDGD